MVFSSIEFLLWFLPVFFILYALTPNKLKNVTLLSGSMIFYALGEPEWLLFLMISVLVNFYIGQLVARPRQKGRKKTRKLKRQEEKCKRLLVAAIIGNVGILALYKFIPGLGGLPLGISFYTFQVLSYLIDVYRGNQRKEMSFLCFATYIVMFPQLMSGPIVTYGEVRRELDRREFTLAGLQEGLKVFTAGLALKVLLADRIGILWNEVQITGFESISTPLAWMGAVAFSLNIYFDFYGYSLMAVGLGQMLGFELPRNFDEPYMACSVRDFYRRWHITLGRWFCRYVYIPLGGSRQGELRTVFNLFAVWLLTAVWHGGTVNFLAWGMFIFLLIVLERQAENIGISRVFEKGILRVVPHLYLWVVIPVTWMCFAITDISQLQVYLGRMFGAVEGIYVNAMDWRKAFETYWYLFGIGFAVCMPGTKRLFRKWKDSLPGILVLAVLFWLCVWRLQVEGMNPFRYFDF